MTLMPAVASPIGHERPRTRGFFVGGKVKIQKILNNYVSRKITGFPPFDLEDRFYEQTTDTSIRTTELDAG